MKKAARVFCVLQSSRRHVQPRPPVPPPSHTASSELDDSIGEASDDSLESDNMEAAPSVRTRAVNGHDSRPNKHERVRDRSRRHPYDDNLHGPSTVLARGAYTPRTWLA